MVSVIITTFNRASLLRRGLDSVLSQKTDFDFEVVVGDDASTDGTDLLLKDYQSRFPEKIRLRLSDKNEGVCINFAKTHDLCRGKYIAVCDSDDEWIDPYKLARQVAFLEANSEYNWITSGCIWFEGEQVVQFNGYRYAQNKKKGQPLLQQLWKSLQPGARSRLMPQDEVDAHCFPHISTWMFRNQLRLFPAWYTYPPHFPNDYILSLMLRPLGDRYDDALHISTLNYTQADGWTKHYLARSTKKIEGHRAYLESLLTILEDVKVCMDQAYHASLDQTKKRLVLIFFKGIRKNVLHLKIRQFLYLIRLSAYVEEAMLKALSRNGGRSVIINQYIVRVFKCWANKFSPLFNEKAMKPN